MLLGRPVFDNCYAITMMMHSKNILDNRSKILYHPMHEIVSSKNDDYYKFNFSQKDKFYKKEMHFWDRISKITLEARTPRSMLSSLPTEIMDIFKIKGEFNGT